MRYLTLQGTTWHYARNYPKDVRGLLGRYKHQQTLSTSDAKVAAERVAVINAKFEDNVRRVRSGLAVADRSADWETDLRDTLTTIELDPVAFRKTVIKAEPLGPLVKAYLRHKGKDLTPGGYKSVRYSIELFASRHLDLDIRKITRVDARTFQHDIGKLSASLGKSNRLYRASLDSLLRESEGCGDRIGVTTRKRIWTQVQGFFDWAIYEGHIKDNPFKTLRFEGKGTGAHYVVPTDAEVRRVLSRDHGAYGRLFLLCLLSGLRSGEALGLLHDDLIRKGNLGTFLRVRPNTIRGLKTAAAERVVPLHPIAEEALLGCPGGDRLFPGLSVNMVTKWFKRTREDLGLDRDGLVFHSSRKWFITQCERQGVPEHFTASLVGHKAARSGNGITYAIYSGGISDAQKRGIIDQLRLPTP